MTSSFAAYLASVHTLGPIHGLTPIDTALSLLEGSPNKRARPNTPDASTSTSSPPLEQFAFFPSSATSTGSFGSTTTIGSPTPTTTCGLRSILASLSSPASSSPPISRPLSRGSSTGASTKSVRFARCTNASVYPALSGDEYDRSPIVPTCEAESLELPKRKRSEAEGWIKCVERARAAAARKAGGGETACAPFSPPLPPPNLVEGLHGLVEGSHGGYFVGEERDADHVIEDRMALDDNDEAGASAAPALIQDDSSGDDSDGVLSITSDLALGLTTPPLCVSPVIGRDAKDDGSLAFGFMDRSVTITAEETDEEDQDDAVVDEHEDEDEEEEDEEESRKKCRDRYGLCALGKYSRTEVYATYDSLGGF